MNNEKMSKEEMEKEVDKVRPYLLKKREDLKLKNKEDRMAYFVQKNGNLTFLILYSEQCLGKKNVGPCGLEVPIKVAERMIRGLVFDKTGEVLIDQEFPSNYCFPYHVEEGITYWYFNEPFFFDEENILIPSKGELWYKNYYQHYRIENGKAYLKNTLNHIIDGRLMNGLTVHSGKFYNFLECKFLELPDFDEIVFPNKIDRYNHAIWLKNLDDMGKNFELIKNKMIEKDLILCFKKIEVEKENIKEEYYTLAFMNRKGKMMDQMLYRSLDDTEFKSLKVSNETYGDRLKELEMDLNDKVNKRLKELAEKEFNEAVKKYTMRMNLIINDNLKK